MRNAFTSAAEVIKAFKAGHYKAYCRNCYNVESGYDNLPTCFSYGLHYPLIIKDRLPDNTPVYLINTSGYSATTAKHIHEAIWRFKDQKTINIEKWFFESQAYEQVMHRCLSYWKESKRCRKDHTKRYKESKAYNLYFRYAQFTSRHIKFIESIDYKKIESIFDSLLAKEAKENLTKQKAAAIAYANSLKAKKQLTKDKLIKGSLKEFFIRVGVSSYNGGEKVNILGSKLIQDILPEHVFFIHYGYKREGDHQDRSRLVLTEASTGLQVRSAEDESFNKFIDESLKLIESKKQFIIDSVNSFLDKQKTEGKV